MSESQALDLPDRCQRLRKKSRSEMLRVNVMFDGRDIPVDIHIRQANLVDITGLMDLVRACIVNMQSQGIDQWDEVYPDRGTIQRDIDDGYVFIARIAGVIAGMAALNEYQDPKYTEVPWRFLGRPAVIHRLMVAPAAEGKGVARALVRFLETRGERIGCNCIRLDVFVQNPRAVRFYELSSYHRAGQVRFRKGNFYCYEKILGTPADKPTDGRLREATRSLSPKR
jgi:GNAT superfamily N-acetyltransferase